MSDFAPRPKPTVHAALLVVQIAFASQAVEGKLLMAPVDHGGEAFPPVALTLVRMIGASFAFTIFSALDGRRALVKENRAREPLVLRDHLTLVGLSLLGVTINQTLFLLGLTRTSSVTATLLSVAIPVFTAGLSVLLGQERLSLRIALGLGCAAAGVVTLTGVARPDLGAILVTLNSLSYSLYLVLSRKTLARLGVFRTLSWLFLWGVVALAPFGTVPLVHALGAASSRALFLVAFIVLVPTILAYLCNAWALVRSTPALVTSYIFLQPPLAAILAYVQLGQTLSPKLLVAAPLIVIGVLLAAYRGRARVVPARAG